MPSFPKRSGRRQAIPYTVYRVDGEVVGAHYTNGLSVPAFNGPQALVLRYELRTAGLEGDALQDALADHMTACLKSIHGPDLVVDRHDGDTPLTYGEIASAMEPPVKRSERNVSMGWQT